MREKIEAAIEVLKEKLAEEERQVADTKRLINTLLERAGLDPIYLDTDPSTPGSITAITGDTFYGDPSVTTASRRYLEMRKVSNLGPATTREIYDALKEGNFQFETEDANNAMTNIRATMRKNTMIFHRMPDSRWGLRAWYDRVKSGKGRSKNDKPTQRRGKRKVVRKARMVSEPQAAKDQPKDEQPVQRKAEKKSKGNVAGAQSTQLHAA